MRNRLLDGTPYEHERYRRTGRTTAHALRCLATAISNPGVELVFHDHYGTRNASLHMASVMRDIADKLELMYITIGKNHKGELYVRSDHIVP